MTWEEYALGIAEVAAGKSKDPWQKVGACVLRNDNTIAGVGYNGFPAGMHEDWQDRDMRRMFVVHAEQNALRHVEPDECRLIAVTLLPCNDCLKAIASYGIKKIVYGGNYGRDESTLALAHSFGIELVQIVEKKLSCGWDHSTKPSMFVVKENGVEVFRGGYSDGEKLLRK